MANGYVYPDPLMGPGGKARVKGKSGYIMGTRTEVEM